MNFSKLDSPEKIEEFSLYVIKRLKNKWGHIPFDEQSCAKDLSLAIYESFYFADKSKKVDLIPVGPKPKIVNLQPQLTEEKVIQFIGKEKSLKEMRKRFGYGKNINSILTSLENSEKIIVETIRSNTGRPKKIYKIAV